MSQPDPEQSDLAETSADDSPPTESATPAEHREGRPGTVTAAAVMAFVLALYEIAAGIGLFAMASQLPGPAPLWYLVGIVHFAFAGLLVWGGIAALNGTTNRILVLTSAAVAVVMVITMIIEITSGYVPRELFVLILYAVVVVLLTRAQSKAFFAARGGSAL